MGRLTRTLAGLPLLLICSMLSGCAGPRATVELSRLFVAEQHGEAVMTNALPGRAELYVRSADGTLRRLGSTTGWRWSSIYDREEEPLESRSHVPRTEEKYYAVSEDGESIVWMGMSDSEDAGSEGVFRYTALGGETRLLDGVQIPSWSHTTPLPASVLAFWDDDFDSTGRTWAVDASGRIYPLALHGAAPLHEAAYKGDVQAVEDLLADGNELDPFTYWGHTPLQIAVVMGHEDVAVHLIEAGASARPQGTSPAWLACVHQHTQILHALHNRSIENGTSFGGDAPLFLAAATPAGARAIWPDDQVFGTWDRFRPSARSGSAEMIDLLSELGVDPLDEESGPEESLHRALSWEVDLAVIAALLRAGIDPNGGDSQERTPLHIAIGPDPHGWRLGSRDPNAAVVEALVEAGADVDAQDSRGDTPLHLVGWNEEDELTREAWREHYLPVLRVLIERTTDIDRRNQAGLTPLQQAVSWGELRTAGALIGSGADATVPCVDRNRGPRKENVAECLHQRERDERWSWPITREDLRKATPN